MALVLQHSSVQVKLTSHFLAPSRLPCGNNCRCRCYFEILFKTIPDNFPPLLSSSSSSDHWSRCWLGWCINRAEQSEQRKSWPRDFPSGSLRFGSVPEIPFDQLSRSSRKVKPLQVISDLPSLHLLILVQQPFPPNQRRLAAEQVQKTTRTEDQYLFSPPLSHHRQRSSSSSSSIAGHKPTQPNPTTLSCHAKRARIELFLTLHTCWRFDQCDVRWAPSPSIHPPESPQSTANL